MLDDIAIRPIDPISPISPIVITLPEFFAGEPERIVELLSEGRAGLVHIRKPGSSIVDMERLLTAIPSEWYRRLVLHDHHRLAVAYGLYGVHLNSRNPLPPEGWTGSVSRSCHTLEEVVQWKDCCAYVSLSPIFDSVSKPGYHAAFSAETLAAAAKAGIIDSKVYALGGVTFNMLANVEAMGFGGAMILGDAWRQVL